MRRSLERLAVSKFRSSTISSSVMSRALAWSIPIRRASSSTPAVGMIPARGKEITLAMYEQGADIVFQIAGGTGVGVFEAAHEQGRYRHRRRLRPSHHRGGDGSRPSRADSDQHAKECRQLHLPRHHKAPRRHLAIRLGTEGLGIPEGGVGLAKNDFYDMSHVR